MLIDPLPHGVPEKTFWAASCRCSRGRLLSVSSPFLMSKDTGLSFVCGSGLSFNNLPELYGFAAIANWAHGFDSPPYSDP